VATPIHRIAYSARHWRASRNLWIRGVHAHADMYIHSYVNTAYSELCLRECVLRVGINQSAHWSGPQCPYYYMHRASSRAISSISRIKRTASPWCRLFLDVHIRTPYRRVIRNGIMDTTDICNGDSLICVCNMYRIHDNIVNSLEQDRAAYTRVDLMVTYLPVAFFCSMSLSKTEYIILLIFYKCISLICINISI